jgi:hypothetical protein
MTSATTTAEPQAPAAAQIQPSNAAPFRAPHHWTDDFLPTALASDMREAVDDHFANPYKHTHEHQVWNYWYVPDMYTFLRTGPDRVIPRALLDQFHQRLSHWAFRALGLGYSTWPYLSVYVDGCHQALHNDATNGRFGYVYSLTWDDRRTEGGETIVLHEGDLYRDNLTNMMGGKGGLYELMDPRFNRLAIFDDRMPHGVRRIDGSMNPVEGRVVLHGHISEGDPVTQGALPVDAVAPQIEAAALEAIGADAASLHGPLVLRLIIAPSGEVQHGRIVLDRLARFGGGRADGVAERALHAASALRFAAAEGPTEATVPVMLGGPLPWMKK